MMHTEGERVALSRVHVALLGAGNWGRRVLASCEASRQLQVRWVCDPAVPAISGDFRTSPHVEEALADPCVHAVLIASPEETHAELALGALDAGKYVFVEKPLCTSHAERALLAAHPLARSRLMVGHILQFDWAFATLARLHRFEPVLRISSVRYSLPGARPARCPWWTLAPHDISVLRRLWGGVERVRLTQGTAHGGGLHAVLQFAGGQSARLALCTVASERRRSFSAFTRAFELQILDHDANRCTLVAGANLRRVRLPKHNPLGRELRHFAACVQRRVAPVNGLEDGLAVVDVLLAGQQSLDTDRWVDVVQRSASSSERPRRVSDVI